MSPVSSGNSIDSKTFLFKIEDSTQIGVARRFAAGLADTLNFEDGQKGRVAIVITELCTNLLNHARQGEVLIRLLKFSDHSALEILAIDRGPGMADLSLCMKDGYSQGSTPGNGLGAISRQSDFFDIYTVENQGTIVLSIVNERPGLRAISTNKTRLGIICIPVHGETECGDGWEYFHDSHGLRVIVADGLGHGLLAHQASQEALRVFAETKQESLTVRMSQIHNALRSTRGAAVSMADIDFAEKKLDFIGIGNVRCVVLEQSKMRTMVCQSGTAGLQIRQAKVFSNSWEKDNLLILHSDGLTTRWDLNIYPGITARHPSIIAAILYRDFNRGNDDVTILVGGFQ